MTVGLAVARADVVEADDLGGRDARGPGGLVQAAVPTGGVQVVLVEQRAVLLPAVRTVDVLVGRQAGVAEQLDAVEAVGREVAEERVEAVPAALGGRGGGAARAVSRGGDGQSRRGGRRVPPPLLMYPEWVKSWMLLWPVGTPLPVFSGNVACANAVPVSASAPVAATTAHARARREIPFM